MRKAILRIEELIGDVCRQKGLPLRWSAVKLIEGDEPTMQTLELSDTTLACIESIVSELETQNIDREMVIADQKYKYICSVTEKCVKRAHEAGHLTLSDKIDRVVTNKYLAIPLFFALMLLIFYITFGALGANLTDWVDSLINDTFASWVREMLVNVGASDWAVGLVWEAACALCPRRHRRRGRGALVLPADSVAVLLPFRIGGQRVYVPCGIYYGQGSPFHWSFGQILCAVDVAFWLFRPCNYGDANAGK